MKITPKNIKEAFKEYCLSTPNSIPIFQQIGNFFKNLPIIDAHTFGIRLDNNISDLVYTQEEINEL